MDKKHTISPAALWWQDRRADLFAIASATAEAQWTRAPRILHTAYRIPPNSALSSVALAKEELGTLRNFLIIKPHPAQSCLIKPNTATNDFRSQSHQIKPNQTIENETHTPGQI
jgi:hypothetical protein